MRKKTWHGKVVSNIASKLYDRLLNIYTTQYDNLSEGQKKKRNVLNRLGHVILDLSLIPPLEGDEKVKLTPEETIAEKVKSHPRKTKKSKNRIKNLDSKQIVN